MAGMAGMAGGAKEPKLGIGAPGAKEVTRKMMLDSFMNGFFFDVRPAHIAHASHTHRTHIAHTRAHTACMCMCMCCTFAALSIHTLCSRSSS